MTSNVSTPTQYAGLAAYTRTEEADAEVERMRSAFENRKNTLAAALKEKLPDVSYVEPEGAFYFFINTKNLAKPGENSLDFCERLLIDANVAVVPGAAFGDDDYFRLSFASPEGALVEAVRRIAAFR
jgi:aspartate aminotransferase